MDTFLRRKLTRELFAPAGIVLFFLFFPFTVYGQKQDPFRPDFTPASKKPGMSLVWSEEFNYTGKPDTSTWIFEKGFVRNQELQWYQEANANCSNGVLLIEGRREKLKNPGYIPESINWRTSREYADYTSASIQTRGHRQWQFGTFEIRARIDTAWGSWPAIWTLGISRSWPSNGEIDIMEFYRVQGVPTILANFAWGTEKRNVAKWDDLRKPLSEITGKDRKWDKKFHIWTMDWNKDSIRLFLDGKLLNSTPVSETVNPDGFNPFLQPHYLLLNLAIGGAGGDPSRSSFPLRYEVDYVRVYQPE
jgi:beta-glucanase (GH16 family)